MRCFLCREKKSSAFKDIDTTTCPMSKKEIRNVIKYLAELSNIEFHIPRQELICHICYFKLSEYDAYLIRTLKKQRDLVQLVEKALISVDSDFEEECETHMNDFDKEMQESSFFDDVQVSDEEINQVLREVINKGKRSQVPLKQQQRQQPNELYECTFCAMVFKAKTPFQKHLNNAHKKFNCELCDYSHRNEDYVLLHMNVHEGRSENQCRYCEKEFTTKISTIRHMEVHFNTKKYQCDKCGLCFSQTTVLYNHKLQHEAEEKPLRCEVCNQLFKTKRTYRHHLVTHQADRPRHACEYCGRNFTEKYTLKVHKRTHHDEVTLETPKEERPSIGEAMVTEEVSTTEAEFVENQPQRQQAAIGGQNPNEVEVGGGREAGGVNKFCCIICDQPFSSRDYMNRHMEKDHDVILRSLVMNNINAQFELEGEQDQPIKQSCQFCKQLFYTQNTLEYHILNVHGIAYK